ncbi:MAG: hypothetical protein QOG74_1681 [Alphaproteobacteria bacterium]|nr:hypothetical protein [Alphaproteobacteria bacterium]
MAHSPPDSRFFGPPKWPVPPVSKTFPKQWETSTRWSAIAIASTLDQDQKFRRKLRRHADCPEEQPLNLGLPVGSPGLQLRPDGCIHTVRAAEIQPATNFDHLVAQSVELQSMIERTRPRITETVSAAILPFLLPGVFPPATSICAWIAGPLSLNGLLIVSVRFCACALEELHSSDLCPRPL